MRDGPRTYVLYPFFGILLSLIIAGAAMSLSSICRRTEGKVVKGLHSLRIPVSCLGARASGRSRYESATGQIWRD
jgi:hypothetical protein